MSVSLDKHTRTGAHRLDTLLRNGTYGALARTYDVWYAVYCNAPRTTHAAQRVVNLVDAELSTRDDIDAVMQAHRYAPDWFDACDTCGDRIDHCNGHGSIG